MRRGQDVPTAQQETRKVKPNERFMEEDAVLIIKKKKKERKLFHNYATCSFVSGIIQMR